MIYTPAIPAAPVSPRPSARAGDVAAKRTPWQRFVDDRDLIGLKIVLLGALILLAAALERAV